MSEEQVQQEVVDSTPSGAEEVTTSESVPEQVQEAAPTMEGEAPQYTPNFKFKVMDAEHEVDEFLRGAITNEEHEKKVRELYEKAYGLDYVKPKYEKLKEEYGNLSGTWQKVVSDFGKLGGYLKNNDYGAFFSSLGLTDEQIMKYAVDRLSYYELPPEKRQAMDEQSRRNKQLVEIQQENERLKQDYASFESQQLMNSVQQTIHKMGASEAVRAIDERAGYTGAFYELLKNHALQIYSRTQRDPSPEEALSSFLKLYGLESGQSQGPSPVAAAQVAQAAQGARPQTIPTLKGSGVSPVRKQVQSIEDLKKIRQQKFGQ